MPRNVRLVDGPSIFSCTKGTPNSVQVAIVIARALEHSDDAGTPRNKLHLDTEAPCELPFGTTSTQMPLQVH